MFLYAVFATCYAYMEQAVWGIWKPYTGFYFDYFSNWLDLVYCLDTFAISFMPRNVHYGLIQGTCNPFEFSGFIVNLNRIHKHTKITQPILGGLSDSFKKWIAPSVVIFSIGARVNFETLPKCLLYWSIIASDKSRLRLNFVSFHQHGIRWGLRIVSF